MNFIYLTINNARTIAVLASDIVRVQSYSVEDWASTTIFVSGDVVHVTESFDAVMALLKGIPTELAAN